MTCIHANWGLTTGSRLLQRRLNCRVLVPGFAFLVAFFPVFLSGCLETPEEADDTCEAIVGDLVISEFLPNPKGADSEREWIEIYNASSVPQVLDRLVVRRINFRAAGECSPESDLPGETCYEDDECLNACRSSTCQDWCGGPFGAPEDGRREVSRHTLRGAGVLAPRSYFVLADGAREDINADYNYSLRRHGNPNSSSYSKADYNPSVVTESLPDFNQQVGGVAIACKGVTIDEVLYGTKDGVKAPVDGSSLSFSGKLAPDAIVNEDPRYWCDSSEITGDEIPGSCALEPGTSCQSDQECESTRRCYRNGRGGDPDEITSVECGQDLDCESLNAAGYCVNGADPEDTLSPCTSKGECLPTYGVCEGENEGAACADRCECGVSCDTKCAGYQKAECRDARVFGCQENVCEGRVASNFGTPGEPNPVCPFVAIDTCLEGDEVERDIRFPEAGDLILTEVFADPSSTDDFPTNSDADRELSLIHI